MTLSDVIQICAVLAAVGAAIVALIIAAADRSNARKIAAEDRREALAHARLMFEWEAAKRLAIIEARGGHTDPIISKDMGSEALALIALLGRERVPVMWEARVGQSDEELQAFVDDTSNKEYLRWSVEAERAMSAIAKEIRQRESRSEGSPRS